MTSEKNSVRVSDSAAGQGPSVSNGRRRLLKGGAVAAPVLLTLRGAPVAAESMGLNGITQAVSDPSLAKSSDYVQVLRNVYTLKQTSGSGEDIKVLNTSVTPSCADGGWVDLDTLSTIFTLTPPCSTPSTQLSAGQKLKSPAQVEYEVVGPATPSTQGLVVGFTPDGSTVLSLGKSAGPVLLASTSSWASVGATAVLPGN